MFKGILLNKNDDGTTRAELTQIDEANLPQMVMSPSQLNTPQLITKMV